MDGLLQQQTQTQKANAANAANAAACYQSIIDRRLDPVLVLVLVMVMVMAIHVLAAFVPS